MAAARTPPAAPIQATEPVGKAIGTARPVLSEFSTPAAVPDAPTEGEPEAIAEPPVVAVTAASDQNRVSRCQYILSRKVLTNATSSSNTLTT